MEEAAPSFQPIDLNAAPLDAVAERMGAMLKQRIRQHEKIEAFSRRSGVPRTVLYRLFDGKPVHTDALLRVLRALGDTQALQALTAEPDTSPLDWLPESERRVSLRSAKPAPRPKLPLA